MGADGDGTDNNGADDDGADGHPVAAPAGGGDSGVGEGGGDSGDEEFVDAEGDDPQVLADDVEHQALVPAPVSQGTPRVAAYHPSPGLAISSGTFSLPKDIRPKPSYNLRSKPEGRTD